MDNKETVIMLYSRMYNNPDIKFGNIKEGHYYNNVEVTFDAGAIVEGGKRLEKLLHDLTELPNRLNKVGSYVSVKKEFVWNVQEIKGSDEELKEMVAEDLRNMYHSIYVPIVMYSIDWEDIGSTSDSLHMTFRFGTDYGFDKVNYQNILSKYQVTRFHNDYGTLENIKAIQNRSKNIDLSFNLAVV